MLVRRMYAALLITGAVLLAGGTPALAHTALKSSNPAKGASLPSAPPEIVLTFSEPVQVEAGAITVDGPGGARWTVGPADVNGAVVTAPVTPAGPAGQYTINYRVISADGDPVRGAVPFALTVAVPVAPTSTTPPTTTSSRAAETITATATATPETSQPTPAAQQNNDSGGIPVWLWIVGALVVVGVGFLFAMRMRKPAPPEDS